MAEHLFLHLFLLFHGFKLVTKQMSADLLFHFCLLLLYCSKFMRLRLRHLLHFLYLLQLLERVLVLPLHRDRIALELFAFRLETMDGYLVKHLRFIDQRAQILVVLARYGLPTAYILLNPDLVLIGSEIGCDSLVHIVAGILLRRGNVSTVAPDLIFAVLSLAADAPTARFALQLVFDDLSLRENGLVHQFERRFLLLLGV